MKPRSSPRLSGSLDRLDQPPEWTNDSLREAVQKGFDAIAAGDLKRINTREELIAFFDGL